MFLSNKFLLSCVCLPVFAVTALAQTAGVGSVFLSGVLQGPIYPCGRRSCVTYDSGQIQITVNGFTATANYGNAPSEKTATQLATALATLLNTPASPVIAKVSKSNIKLTSKLTGTASNYPLSTVVTHGSFFKHGSFSATASGVTLSGGTGPVAPIATLNHQTGNNSSLCSSATDPGGNWPYCSNSFEGFNTNATDAPRRTFPILPLDTFRTSASSN